MCHGRFSLMDCLDEIEAPRAASNGTLYDFREMLVIAICASLCDMDTCEDFAVWAQAREPWLKKFLTLKNGTPSSATFYRLFRTLDPKQFETFFRRWVSQIIPAAAAPGQMAIANDFYPGCLQPDADGDDLWLAIEHGVGRNPPTGCRKAAQTPVRGHKTG